MLAGHHLDLDRFTSVRHTNWSEAAARSGRVDDHLAVIVEEVRGVASALIDSGRPLAMGLTGGADSRMLLAALRGMTDSILFYTVDAPGARFDRDRAVELAQRFGLRHRVLPYARASARQAEQWDRRVGHAVVTANRTMFPSVTPLEGYACLSGLGGEVGRGFLWRERARLPARIMARDIVDRLKLPRLPTVEARIGTWLANLPSTDPHRVLDIAYIEQRMSAWAFAQSYANPTSLVLHPLGSAVALRAMLALPATYRQGDGMVRGVIERCWPELLELPINRYGDARDYARQAGKLANPGRAWRKLRQIARS